MSTKKSWTFLTNKDVWLDKSLTTDAKVVWHIMSAWRNHQTGETYPSTWTLQQVAQMGRSRVNKAVKVLVAAGAITKAVVRRHSAKGVLGSKCIYTVSQVHQWVQRTSSLSNPDMLVSDMSGAGRPVIGSYQLPSTEQLPSSKEMKKIPGGFDHGIPEALKQEVIVSLTAERGFPSSDVRTELDRVIREIRAGLTKLPSHWPAYLAGRMRMEAKRAKAAQHHAPNANESRFAVCH